MIRYGVLLDAKSAKYKETLIDLANNTNVQIFAANRIFINTNVSVLPIKELHGFNKPVFTLTAEAADILLHIPTNSTKILFIQDIDWNLRAVPYEMLQYVYQHDKLKLVCSKQEIADAVSECWKKPEAIIERLTKENINGFLQIK